MAAFGRGEGSLHAGNAAADNDDLALSGRHGNEVLLGDALIPERIDGALSVVGGVLADVHFRGEGAALGAVEAEVAAQAGADVLKASFTDLVDEVAVGQGLPRREHVVGLAFFEQPFGEIGIVNAAHHAHGNLDAGLLGEFAGSGVVRSFKEVRGVHLRTAGGIEAGAAGHVQHIRFFGKNEGLFRGVFRGDAAFHHVGAVHAHFDDQIVAHFLTDALHDHERVPAAVFHAAAEFVGAVVGERREKVVHEPTVTIVQCDGVEAGSFDHERGVRVHLRHVFHVLVVHFLDLTAVVHEGARAHDGAAGAGGHAAAGVIDFTGTARAVGMHHALKLMHVHEGMVLLVDGIGAGMAAVLGHFDGQAYLRKAAAGKTAVVFFAYDVDEAVGVRAERHAHGSLENSVLVLDFVLADDERGEKKRIFFLVQRFHERPPEKF